MVDVWMGGRNVREAIRAGAITLAGSAALTREFSTWLLLSVFAKIPAAPAAPTASRSAPTAPA